MSLPQPTPASPLHGDPSDDACAARADLGLDRELDLAGERPVDTSSEHGRGPGLLAASIVVSSLALAGFISLVRSHGDAPSADARGPTSITAVAPAESVEPEPTADPPVEPEPAPSPAPAIALRARAAPAVPAEPSAPPVSAPVSAPTSARVLAREGTAAAIASPVSPHAGPGAPAVSSDAGATAVDEDRGAGLPQLPAEPAPIDPAADARAVALPGVDAPGTFDDEDAGPSHEDAGSPDEHEIGTDAIDEPDADEAVETSVRAAHPAAEPTLGPAAAGERAFPYAQGAELRTGDSAYLRPR